MTHREGVDTAATFSAYLVAAEAAGPDAATLAREVWARLASDRWTLEWQLPRWLGEAFGAEAEVIHRIQAGTVLGLASIRLADDLADGEVAPGSEAAAERLASALYEPALAPYRELFASDHPFWRRLEAWMRAWRRHANGPAAALERRGAPLRIPAFAICLLTGREAAFPALARSLDHALRALALYDDVCDWRQDLAAGRWNAFAGSDRDPRRVEARLLAGTSVGPHFARIDRELERAAAIAGALGVTGLAAHLSSVRISIRTQGRQVESRFDALGDAATQLFFGQYAT